MGRTLFIGDVHGCAEELDELLGLAGYCSADQLVFVGDMIARGPGSCRVLKVFRETGALGVLGNHEWRMLAVRSAKARGGELPKLGPAHHQLYDELETADWDTLASLPMHCDLPAHDIRVVHAGVVPGIPFENQDPWALLHLRTLRPDGTPAASAAYTPWGQGYGGDPHVVFGHNSRAALQLHPHATGLDTACVYGGWLTALVLDDGEPVPQVDVRPTRLISVPARQRYYLGGDGAPRSVRERWGL